MILYPKLLINGYTHEFPLHPPFHLFSAPSHGCHKYRLSLVLCYILPLIPHPPPSQTLHTTQRESRSDVSLAISLYHIIKSWSPRQQIPCVSLETGRHVNVAHLPPLNERGGDKGDQWRATTNQKERWTGGGLKSA